MVFIGLPQKKNGHDQWLAVNHILAIKIISVISFKRLLCASIINLFSFIVIAVSYCSSELCSFLSRIIWYQQFR